MESLNGYVENSNSVRPNWGTPHWVPLAAPETSPAAPERPAPPTGFIRLQSAFRTGIYLFETAAGGIAAGDCAEGDPRGHWQFLPRGDGTFSLVNRASGRAAVNLGNGVLRGLSAEEAGGAWELSADGAAILLANVFEGQKVYQRPFLNIQSRSGLAQSSLVSVEAATTKWLYEAAPEGAHSPDEEDDIPVPLTALRDTNVYRLYNGGQALDGAFLVEYIGVEARLRDDASGRILTHSLRRANSSSELWTPSYTLGQILFTGRDTVLRAEIVARDAVYTTENAIRMGGRQVFTVYADKGGEYTTNLPSEAEVFVNGLPQSGGTLMLHKGINTVALTSDAETLVIYNCPAISYRGASTGYLVYEAEDGETNADILNPSREVNQIASEASGRSAVRISRTGQYVRFTLSAPANALVIRYSIPDTPDGAGSDATLNVYADNVAVAKAEMTSRFTWNYGVYPWTNDPADGNPRNFFDEALVRLDRIYPAGTVIKLQKDVDSFAPTYWIDVVETEITEDALPRPEGSISIKDFPGTDGEALRACIDEASASGKEVWLPAGTYEIAREFLIDAPVTIRGAGMWHTVLRGASFMVRSSDVSFYDFAMDGDAITRRDNIDPAAIETDNGRTGMSGLTVQNIWFTHYKVAVWVNGTRNVHIAGCRIRNTFADGINFRRAVTNGVIEQCDIRGTGDDGIGLWSAEENDTNIVIRHNTIRLPWLANAVAAYGGADITITDNLLSDTVLAGAGVNISTNFQPALPRGTFLVARNTLTRCGSQTGTTDIGAVWFNTIVGYDNNAAVIVEDNLILNSAFQGVSFENNGLISNVTMRHNVIIGADTWGVDVLRGARGSLTAYDNLIRGAILGPIRNGSEESFAIDWIINPLPGNTVFWTAGVKAAVWGGGGFSLLGLGVLIWLLLSVLKQKRIEEEKS
jgi:hypothetical protein